MDDNTAIVLLFVLFFIWSAVVFWIVTRRR
jgi:hypothetical protein